MSLRESRSLSSGSSETERYWRLYAHPAQAWWHASVALVLLALGIGMGIWMLRLASEAWWEPAALPGPWELLLWLEIGIAWWIPCSLWAVHIGLRRPLGYLFSVYGHIRWGVLMRAWAVALAAAGGMAVLDFWITGALPAHRFAVPWTAVAVLVLFTPLQAAGEELVFRGALQQIMASWAGRWTGRAWLRHVLVLAMPSLLFAALHGQQDVPLFAMRCLLGLVFAWVTVRTGGLEVAMALHAANNQAAIAEALCAGRVSALLLDTHMAWPTLGLQLGGTLGVAWLLVCRSTASKQTGQMPGTSRGV